MSGIKPESRIMLVDDFELVRFILKGILDSLGYKNSEEAENGNAAWTKLTQAANQKSPYDIVFCDWNMPELNGIDLLQKIRQDHLLRHTQFVMVTAEAEYGKIATAYAHQVSDYLVKPFSTNGIANFIKVYNARNQSHEYKRFG